ncbi:MAG: DNA polymerase III subunit beta [Candidatus Daviesbacteria bacterium]|nr:MAG: DNA polymerase III subunit beta [Candidatus Daviesbacteria bacterium]
MKFSILQQDLLPALQAVSRCVNPHASLPVLANIYLSAQGQEIRLAATNLEIGIFKTFKAEIIEEGEITVPARMFLDLISSLPGTKLDFETSQDILLLKSGKFKAQINGLSASEFPVIPLPQDHQIDFPSEVFRTSQSILFAAATDEGRPTLTGILVFTKGDNLNFVATDGFRLAFKEVKLTKTQEFKFLVPRRTFEEVLRLLDEEEVDNLKVTSSPNQVVFAFSKTILSSRLIEGSFPAWEKIIPTEIKTRLIINKEELLKALKIASVFAKNEANIINLDLKKEGLIVKSASRQLGSQEMEVEGQIEGEELLVAFNAKFLLDAVSNLPTSQAMLEFSGELTPCLAKPVGMEGLQYVVMPMGRS